jgi:hypothetical protein
MNGKALSVALAVLLCASLALVSALGQDQPPKVQIPQPGVPQIMTMEGQYVRAAYNNEGYAILSYKLANESIGGEYLMLEFGTTVRDGVKNYTLTRDKLSLDTPDGKTIPLMTTEDYRKAPEVRALERQASVVRDSINYFPPSATRACRIGFFAELGSPANDWDQVELSNNRACLGRLFFKVPGGIAYGQHWLNVQYRDTLLRVPFKILTKDEQKILSKNYKDISKQVKEAFAPPKKK